jgi:amidase
MENTTILELQSRMDAGELSARSLAEYYLGRIERLDRSGPKLNAIIELNPRALEIADALDAERAQGKRRGALHGIPIVLKDNIDTADGMMTTSGSLALEGHHAEQDAFLAARLRAAGALILGKTNLSEWANFRSTHSSSGWSSRGGQTRNPYALDRTPCGSSSGSGVAVAADLCTAAIGTETDGSIICPSHINGIVGLKPTLGLVSRSGVIPIAHSQDTAGPMARSVADLAVVLGALTGIDPRDPDTAASQGKALSDYTPFLDDNALRGARIGVARSYFGFDSRVDRIIEACIDAMKAAGADIVEDVKVVPESKLGRDEVEVLLYEFKQDLNAYLSGCGATARVRSFDDVIRFNEENRNRVMPYFGQERMLAARRKGRLVTQKYTRALEKARRLARQGIDAPLQEHNLQAILVPTGGPAWLVDLVNGDNYTGGGFTGPAAVAGYPHITVPAGYVFGLPVGLSFFASAWQEPALIRIAHAFERATQVRRPPQFLRTVDLTAPEVS